MKNNQLLEQLITNKSVEVNFEPHGEETSKLRKDHPLSWFLNSQHHTLGDTHMGHHGPKLDMHKFDGMDPAGLVSQMEHFFYLHNMCTYVDKYQITLVYLDVEFWKWWHWNKQCMGGHLDWSTFLKVLCSCFDQESYFLGWLTKLYQMGMVK